MPPFKKYSSGGSLFCAQISAAGRSSPRFSPPSATGEGTAGASSQWCRDGPLCEASRGELNSGEELMLVKGCSRRP